MRLLFIVGLVFCMLVLATAMDPPHGHTGQHDEHGHDEHGRHDGQHGHHDEHGRHDGQHGHHDGHHGHHDGQHGHHDGHHGHHDGQPEYADVSQLHMSSDTCTHKKKKGANDEIAVLITELKSLGFVLNEFHSFEIKEFATSDGTHVKLPMKDRDICVSPQDLDKVVAFMKAKGFTLLPKCANSTFQVGEYKVEFIPMTDEDFQMMVNHRNFILRLLCRIPNELFSHIKIKGKKFVFQFNNIKLTLETNMCAILTGLGIQEEPFVSAHEMAKGILKSKLGPFITQELLKKVFLSLLKKKKLHRHIFVLISSLLNLIQSSERLDTNDGNEWIWHDPSIQAFLSITVNLKEKTITGFENPKKSKETSGMTWSEYQTLISNLTFLENPQTPCFIQLVFDSRQIQKLVEEQTRDFQTYINYQTFVLVSLKSIFKSTFVINALCGATKSKDGFPQVLTDFIAHMNQKYEQMQIMLTTSFCERVTPALHREAFKSEESFKIFLQFVTDEIETWKHSQNFKENIGTLLIEVQIFLNTNPNFIKQNSKTKKTMIEEALKSMEE